MSPTTVSDEDAIRLSLDPTVRSWVMQKSHKTAEEERAWGSALWTEVSRRVPPGGKRYHSNWSGNLGEQVIRGLLLRAGKDVASKTRYRVGSWVKETDLMTQDGFFEIKTRSWFTPGSAGLKVPGVFVDYGPMLDKLKGTGKAVYVVSMAFQEVECREKYELFGSKSEARTAFLDLCERNGMVFLAASDMMRDVESLDL